MADMHKISVMISEEELQAKISELGEKISADYEGKEVKLICILKGSAFFCCELAKRITVPVKIDSCRLQAMEVEQSQVEI